MGKYSRDVLVGAFSALFIAGVLYAGVQVTRMVEEHQAMWAFLTRPPQQQAQVAPTPVPEAKK